MDKKSVACAKPEDTDRYIVAFTNYGDDREAREIVGLEKAKAFAIEKSEAAGQFGGITTIAKVVGEVRTIMKHEFVAA